MKCSVAESPLELMKCNYKLPILVPPMIFTLNFCPTRKLGTEFFSSLLFQIFTMPGLLPTWQRVQYDIIE